MTPKAPLNTLAPGNVLGIVAGKSKALTEQEWHAALDKIWPAFIAEMSTNPGYMGAFSTWDADHPRQVSINGIWQTMAHRVAYEAKSSTAVRAIFNELIDDRVRNRLVIGRLA